MHSFHELFDLVTKSKLLPSNMQLFLLDDKGWFRYYKGRTTHNMFHKFVDENRSPNRGNLLDSFAILEFLLAELIRIRIIGIRSESTLRMNDVLAKIGFSEKIKLIREWKLITNEQEIQLRDLTHVRNMLAHKFDISEMEYHGKPLKTNFECFAKQMNSIWEELRIVYLKHQDSKEVEKLIKQIQQMNEKE